jgi:hypothetical protein
LQKKILITATDIFAISSQKQFENSLKSIYQHENNLYREFCDLMKVESQNKNTQQIPFYPFSFSERALFFPRRQGCNSNGTALHTSAMERRKRILQFWLEDYGFGFTSYLEEGSSLIYMAGKAVALPHEILAMKLKKLTVPVQM